MIVCSCISGILSSYAGRKPALLGGSIMAIHFLGGLVVAEYFKFKIISIMCIFGFLGIYGMTIGPNSWIYLSEILSDKAMNFVMTIMFVMIFIIGFIFPSMVINFGISGSFSIFLILTVIMSSFFYFVVPKLVDDEEEK